MTSTIDVDWAREVNAYGECAATDIQGVALAIQRLVKARGAELELDVFVLARQILLYVTHRRRGLRALQISGPRHAVKKPAGGWDDAQESIWQEWVWNTFSLVAWTERVMEPVFGRGNCHEWELVCGGWREEVYAMLPWWIRRDAETVRAYDGTPLDEERTFDPFKGKIDPFLLEHGGKLGRKLKGKAEQMMDGEERR
jgi:hypothetical protein